MQEWQRQRQQHQQTSYDFVNLHTIEMNDQRKKKNCFMRWVNFNISSKRERAKIWLLFLNRFIYRFQSYYFKIVLPCLWHDIDIAEVTSERHIKCDTITIIKFIYFGWVSDKTHYITSLSIFRSTHLSSLEMVMVVHEKFPIHSWAPLISFGFLYSLTQSLTHVLYRTSVSSAPHAHPPFSLFVFY